MCFSMCSRVSFCDIFYVFCVSCVSTSNYVFGKHRPKSGNTPCLSIGNEFDLRWWHHILHLPRTFCSSYLYSAKIVCLTSWSWLENRKMKITPSLAINTANSCSHKEYIRNRYLNLKTRLKLKNLI